jgi:hypothetical protein
MPQLDNLNRHWVSSSKAATIKNRKLTLASTSQHQLDEVGGEPLVGSGFENEESESGFASDGEES